MWFRLKIFIFVLVIITLILMTTSEFTTPLSNEYETYLQSYLEGFSAFKYDKITSEESKDLYRGLKSLKNMSNAEIQMRLKTYPEIEIIIGELENMTTALVNLIQNRNIATDAPLSNTRRQANINMHKLKLSLENGRNITDPHDEADCLRSDREYVRDIPFQCYGDSFSHWNEDDDLKPFLNEIINDFKFAFDFILYDNTSGNKKENQFWYLMLYLKTLAEGVPNPKDIVTSIRGDNKLYCLGPEFRKYKLKQEDLKAKVIRAERHLSAMMEIING